jgi:hypothetical protein
MTRHPDEGRICLNGRPLLRIPDATPNEAGVSRDGSDKQAFVHARFFVPQNDIRFPTPNSYLLTPEAQP